MKSNLSSGKSSAGERNAEPALLTRMSTRPASRRPVRDAVTSQLAASRRGARRWRTALLGDERRRLGAPASLTSARTTVDPAWA